MANCCCQNPECDSHRRKRPGVIGLLFNLALLYVTLVFGGGTLINTGHPVATEVGRIMHVVTFVEPTISWADGKEYRPIAKSLRVLAHGYPIA